MIENNHSASRFLPFCARVRESCASVEPALACPDHEGTSAINTKLLIERCHVVSHRVRRELQLLADFGIDSTPADQGDDVVFALREIVKLDQ
jgi:hypothetical protein